MGSLFFQSHNLPLGVKPKVTVHPYIYSRTTTEVTVGVYCEEPAPVSDTATVRMQFPGSSVYPFQVPITKGLRDSGLRATIKIDTSGVQTRVLYKNFLVISMTFGSAEYQAGARSVCPTLTFNLSIYMDISSGSQVPVGKYLNPFGSGTVMLDPSDLLFESSDLDDIPPLTSKVGSCVAHKAVEISRARALLVPTTNLNTRMDFYAETNLINYNGYFQYLLKADLTEEKIGAVYGGFGNALPNLNKTFGSPTLGEYIHAGVSVFHIDAIAEEIGTYA